MKNKSMKTVRIFGEVLALTALLVGNVSLATTTATVTATVTLSNVSVSVTDGSVSYGTLAVNATKTTLAAGLNDQQTATNAGNVTEDFNIKGQNSGAWTLSNSAAGVDVYMEKFCTATCGSEASPTNFTALSTSYATLATGITVSGTKAFDLLINTPTSSSTFTSQSVDVTVQAVAS